MIFVVGNSRSGTTMMGRILGSHPDVLMFRELHFFEELWSPEGQPEALSNHAAKGLVAQLLSIQREGYMARRNPDSWQNEAAEIIPPDAISLMPMEVYGAFLRYEAKRTGAKIACEQTPRNLFYLDSIMEAFPSAVVVEMVRDPRDVLVSKKHKWKRSYLGGSKYPFRAALLAWANYHPIVTVRLWVSAVRAGSRAQTGSRHIRVRYEDFLETPEVILRKVCGLAGINYLDVMLDVPQVGSSLQADSGAMGIRKSSAGRWRQGGLNETELAVCQKIAGKEMLGLGYDMTSARCNYFLLAGYYLLLPLKLGAALIMNLSRLSSIKGAIKRRLN